VQPSAGAKLGWATGATGLIYFVQLPALLFFWVQSLSIGLNRGRLGALALATLVATGLAVAWQVWGTALLGLTFAGGNNDYAGEALARWLQLVRQGPQGVVNQLRTGSLRGLFAGAFYYPWWILAVLGLLSSPRAARNWSLALFVAAAVPAIAFSTRFQLPRLAYFAFPAIYLLAAAGVATIATGLGGGSRRRELAVAGALVIVLALLSNLDLLGWQLFNVWFHYGQGSTW
jgi:hypothetical protein